MKKIKIEAEENYKETEENVTLGKIILGIIVVYLLLAVALFFASNDWVDRGTFGDMFGSLNTLFSGLAFGVVAYSVVLQRRDLDISRKDFKLQTDMQKTQLEDIKLQAEATAKSAEKLEEQQRILNYQMIQETILGFLNLKNKMIENRQTKSGASSSDYDVFLSYYNNKKDPELINRYLHIIFYTLQYIQDSDLDDKQKDALGELVKIYTADKELWLLNDAWKANQYQHRKALLKRFKLDL